MGYAHNFYPKIFDENNSTNYNCQICNESILKHQEHLEFFRSNLNEKPRKKRLHSFSEHEKNDLVK